MSRRKPGGGRPSGGRPSSARPAEPHPSAPPPAAPPVRAAGDVLVHDQDRVLDGRQVRRLTAQIQDARAGRGFAAVVSEVWYTIVTLGLCIVFVVGIASTIQEAAADAAGGVAAVAMPGELPAALVVLAMAGGLLSLSGRLGPVGVGGGGASWWLPLPVDRRGLLGPTVLRWPAVAAVVGMVLAPLIVVGFGAPGTVERVLGWAALGAGSFALLAALAALLQGVGGGAPGLGGSSRRIAQVGEVVMLLATGLVATIALVGPAAAEGVPAGADAGSAGTATTGGPLWDLASTWVLGGAWWVAAPLLVAAVAVTVLAERRTGLLSGAGLRAQGSIGDRAQVAVLSLDLRELSRALTSGAVKARRRGSLRLSGPFAHGPRRAVVLADLVLLGRTPRLLAQVAVATLLAVAATRVPLLGTGLPLFGTLLVLGFWAANAAVAGGRQAEMAPVLDRLLPLSARAARVTRGVVPLLAAVLWSAVVLGTVAVASGEPMWFALAPAWALVLAAAAVRSAYRPPPGRGRVPVSSPMGAAPSTGGMFKGLDVALVGTLPTAIMLYVGSLTAMLVAVQWWLAILVVGFLVAMSGRRPRPQGRPAS